ncbi:serpin family protein, partial [Myxococcota bacterium]|nr:serpin family protein [Myxococcota bacterium]
SMNTALGMAFLGAMDLTRGVFEKACHFSSDSNYSHAAAAALVKKLVSSSKDLKFSLENRIEISRIVKMQPVYVKALKTWYAPTRAVSQPPTRLLALINTTTFSGTWQAGFDKRRTRHRAFTIPGGGKVQVPTMNQVKNLPVYLGRQFQAVKLMYKGRSYSMLIFLPSAAKPLAAVEKAVLNSLKTSESGMDFLFLFSTRRVTLYLPRFSFRVIDYDLRSPLKNMGFDIMAPAMKNFLGMFLPSAITKGRGISAISQTVSIDVSEKGTVAKAVSRVVFGVMSPRPRPLPPVVFDVNRPFLFALVHNDTGTLLFLGRVTNPRVKKWTPAFPN